MKKLSLRLRLIICFMTISCFVWLSAGFLSWYETRGKIDEFFDTYQMALARQLASADWKNMTSDSQKITNKLIENIHNAEEEDEAIGFAVFDAKGQMIFHDDENGKEFQFNPVVGNFVEQIVDGDEAWRLVWLKSADQKYVIAVGQELEYREEIVWDMAEGFMVPWGAGLFVLLVMIVAIISREFWPLQKLAEDIKNRESGDLSALSDKNLPKEVLPLISSMNQLLSQIGMMLKRERSFIADSAHELRTPLTALKIQLEVAQLAQDDEKTRNEALQKLQLGIERSERLVEQLLALSRIETSLTSTEMSADVLDWDKLVQSVAEEYQLEAKAKNIKIGYDLTGLGPVEKGNSVLWALLLRNLIDNAIKYTPQGEEIQITVNAEQIEVINSGTCVDEVALSRLSERFFRPAGQKVSGSGLGLSIVKSIARHYGCELVFANTLKGFSVKVVL